MTLLQPQEIDISGNKYVIHKFPAVAGREITAKYMLSIKSGEYTENQEVMLKLMSFVTVNNIPLTTVALIDNHVPSWEILLQIESAIMEYNCSFFPGGQILSFLKDFAQNIPQFLTQIRTDFLQLLSGKNSLPSTS